MITKTSRCFEPCFSLTYRDDTTPFSKENQHKSFGKTGEISFFSDFIITREFIVTVITSRYGSLDRSVV